MKHSVFTSTKSMKNSKTIQIGNNQNYGRTAYLKKKHKKITQIKGNKKLQALLLIFNIDRYAKQNHVRCSEYLMYLQTSATTTWQNVHGAKLTKTWILHIFFIDMLFECAQFIHAAHRNFDVSCKFFFLGKLHIPSMLFDSKLKETKWIFEYAAHNIYVLRASESEYFQRKSFFVCTLTCQNDWHLWCRQSFHLVNWFRTSLTRNCYAENGEKGYFNPSYSFLQTIKDKKWFFLSMLLNSYAGMKISNKTKMWPSFFQYFRPLCLL